MIRLNHGGHYWFAGAGSLGFDGFDGGHPPIVRAYKWPYRLLGLLDPCTFAVVSKTVTLAPRKGNQTDWSPWRCARLLSPWKWRSMVNAVALTNPGLSEWIRSYYLSIRARRPQRPLTLLLSLSLADPGEAKQAGRLVAPLGDLAGVQLNCGCPNLSGATAAEEEKVRHLIDVVDAFREHYKGAVLLKYGAHQPWEAMVKALDGYGLAGNELINAAPWHMAPEYNPDGPNPSPLSRYGYDGSVSGGLITHLARQAARRYVALKLKTPLISGGGMVAHPGFPDEGDSRPDGWPAFSLKEEARLRLEIGASAVAFSTAFLWEPAGPNRVARELDHLPRELARHRLGLAQDVSAQAIENVQQAFARVQDLFRQVAERGSK